MPIEISEIQKLPTLEYVCRSCGANLGYCIPFYQNARQPFYVICQKCYEKLVPRAAAPSAPSTPINPFIDPKLKVGPTKPKSPK